MELELTKKINLKTIHLIVFCILKINCIAQCFDPDAQCFNSTNINLQFGINMYSGELCYGGLNISNNDCPAYQSLPSGTIVYPGYTSLIRNRTNTLIDYSNLELIFEDNFDDLSIDESRWDLHTDYMPGGYGFYHSIGMEYYSLPGDVTVSNGSAHLWAKYHSTPFLRKSVDWKLPTETLDDGVVNERLWHYSSGYLHSQQYFKHGVFEIRAKIPDITNVWPALWLYGSPGEIDLLEMTRNGLEPTGRSNNTMYLTYHCDDYPITPLTCLGKITAGRRLIQLVNDNTLNCMNFANTWHTFKLLWTENIMQWIIDNQILYTEYQYYASNDGNLMFPMINGTFVLAFEAAGYSIYYNRAFPQRQMKLILSQAIINSATETDIDGVTIPAKYPNQVATDLSSLPKEFEIDYVKVYGLNSCGSDVNYCNENTRLRDLPSYIHGANITIGGNGCNDVLERESDVHEERYYKRNIEVKASNSIHLQSGFHIAEKSLFHASIEPCINNQRMQPEPQPDPIDISSLGLNQSGDLLYSNSNLTAISQPIIFKNDLSNLANDSVKKALSFNQNLYSAYPSPANNEINIKFELKEEGDIDIVILDTKGRIIGNIFSRKNIEPNSYSITFDSNMIASGVYFVRFSTLQEIKILKLIVCHE